MENVTMIQETPQGAVAVQDDPAHEAYRNGPTQPSALVETALATQGTVSKEPLLTLPTFKEMLDAGMTNPTVMTVHELAPIVVRGCDSMRLFVPYINTFLKKCENLPRDSKNRWLVAIEGCYSLKEFFINKCRRTPQAIYEQIRKAEKAEAEVALMAAGTPPPPKPKPGKKPAVTITIKESVSEEAVAAEVEKVKNEVFEQGRAAERMIQEKRALESEANGTENKVHILAALELADTFALSIAAAVNSNGKVNDVKVVKAARKAAVAYCKLRGISFVSERAEKRVPKPVETTETFAQETDRLLAEAHPGLWS
jgi:hypothetical protein